MSPNNPIYVKSIERKLRHRFFFRTFSLLVSIDLLIILLTFIFLLNISEHRLLDSVESGTDTQSVPEYAAEHYKGITIPSYLALFMPIKKDGKSGKIMFDPNVSEENTTLKNLIYVVTYTQSGKSITLKYSFITEFEILFPLFIILIIFELITLFRSSRSNKYHLKKTLRSIDEMVYTMNTITPDIPYVGQLAGQISNIRTGNLDYRISVEDKPEELKPLALEINSLLQRISHAYEAQVNFISDAAHELRTPVSIIQGYANLLDRWGKTDEKTLQESIDAIKSEADSMKYLLEQLHFLAKGENDTLTLNLTEFNVSELIHETAEEMRIIDPAHSYETKCPNASLPTKADRDLLKQALRILLENGKKYSAAGTTITIAAEETDEYIRLSVEDNGMGIPPEDLPHVFERFYRSEASRTKKTGGSGLGLAIVALIAETHDFEISILSRLGIGTRASVSRIPSSVGSVWKMPKTT